MAAALLYLSRITLGCAAESRDASPRMRPAGVADENCHWIGSQQQRGRPEAQFLNVSKFLLALWQSPASSRIFSACVNLKVSRPRLSSEVGKTQRMKGGPFL